MAPLPGKYDITARQGHAFSLSLVYEDDDGNAIDLTGYQAAMPVRARHKSGDHLVTLTDGDGITLGGAEGTIDLAVSATEMDAQPAGSGVYDLILTPPSGADDAFALLTGDFTITPRVQAEEGS